MKIKSNITNNFSQTKIQSFSAGLNAEIMKTIKASDINKISDKFVQHSIPVDFKDNKIIAWCCERTLDVIKDLKNKFGINFGLPSGIFVDDFDNMSLEFKQMYGFCNLLPCELYKGRVIPPKTIFYNTFEHQNKQQLNTSKIFSWECLDSIADNNFKKGISPTDYFLDMFFHEFAHSAHEENMIQKLGGKTLAKRLEQIHTKEYLDFYRQKSRLLFANELCEYALKSPLDAVASDISKRLCVFLKNNENSFANSSY